MTEPTTSTLLTDVDRIVRRAIHERLAYAVPEDYITTRAGARQDETDPTLVIVKTNSGGNSLAAQSALTHSGYAVLRQGLDLWVRYQEDKAGRLRDAIKGTVRQHEDADFPTDLAAAAREELTHVWHDLYEHRNRAVNGVWSMGCEATVYRIVLLSRLVGATSWREVQTDLIVDGVYQQVHEQARIPYEPIDMDKVRETHERNHPVSG